MSEERKLEILNETLGDYYASSKEFLFYCPRCEHHKKKLSVNFEKDAFKCWVCDWSGHGLYKLVRRYGTSSQRSEWKSFSGQVEIENFSKFLFEKEEEKKEQILKLPKEFISLANKKLPPTAAYAMNYLTSRGLNKSDIIRWKIGYCAEGEYSSRIIVPSFGLSGGVNYFMARSYARDWKKYKNPHASKDIVFNHLYLDFDEDLILVEGVFDAIVAGENSVPILGSTLREDHVLFQEIVKNDTPVYLALDQDADVKAMSIIQKLIKYDVEVYKINTSPFKDVGEMSKKAFLERKQSAEFINSSNYLLRKIRAI